MEEDERRIPIRKRIRRRKEESKKKRREEVEEIETEEYQ